MRRKYTGVVNRKNNEYILLTNGEDINLSYILHDLWQKEVRVHIEINNDKRKLLNEYEGEIYFDRDKNKKYCYHINNINIEDILLKNVHNLIDIQVDSEDAYEAACSNS